MRIEDIGYVAMTAKQIELRMKRLTGAQLSMQDVERAVRGDVLINNSPITDYQTSLTYTLIGSKNVATNGQIVIREMREYVGDKDSFEGGPIKTIWDHNFDDLQRLTDVIPVSVYANGDKVIGKPKKVREATSIAYDALKKL